jgi:hypothetical protein
MELPSRDDVTTTWSESEPFDGAQRIYDNLVTARTPPEAAQIVAKSEASRSVCSAGLTHPSVSRPRCDRPSPAGCHIRQASSRAAGSFSFQVVR